MRKETKDMRAASRLGDTDNCPNLRAYVRWPVVLMLAGVLALLLVLALACAGAGARHVVQPTHMTTELASAKHMHDPPSESEMVALAARDSAGFCRPPDRSVNGCRIDAVLVGAEWTVFAWPNVGSPKTGYACCAPDSARLFIYSRDGRLLRQERGGP